MCIELKIKAKHLALEPQIIRAEEKKLVKRMKYHESGGAEWLPLKWKLDSLTNHRKHVVRNEARATHLARAFIANKSYVSCERKRNDDIYFVRFIVPRILAMVTKYGTREQRKLTQDDIITWANVAE